MREYSRTKLEELVPRRVVFFPTVGYKNLGTASHVIISTLPGKLVDHAVLESER
jgi:hypothetical protein